MYLTKHKNNNYVVLVYNIIMALQLGETGQKAKDAMKNMPGGGGLKIYDGSGNDLIFTNIKIISSKKSQINIIQQPTKAIINPQKKPKSK